MNITTLVDALASTEKTKYDIAQILNKSGIAISKDKMEEIKKNSSINPSSSTDDKELDLPSDFLSLNNSLPMTKEIKALVKKPSKKEARFLGDLFYQTQEKRISVENQLRSILQDADNKSESEDNNKNNELFLMWYFKNLKGFEVNIKKALEAFSNSFYISRWAKANTGIGPILATSLAANLEITSPDMHAGNWWSYCGLNDNNRPWLGKEASKKIIDRIIEENSGVLNDEAVQKIAVETKWPFATLKAKAFGKKWKKEDLIKACSLMPYNKSLKVTCYKIGHSFRLMTLKGIDFLYGRKLVEREAYENAQNEAGAYAEQAAAILASKKFDKTTNAYKSYSKGMLPPAHIQQRAERWVVKLFISHLFEAAYYNKYGIKCPEPYVIGFTGHSDYIPPEVSYESIERDADTI